MPSPVHHVHDSPRAWELVPRVSRLRVGDEIFQPIPLIKTTFTSLVNPAGNSDLAIEMTMGFNWYLTAWTRFQFN